VKNQPQPVIFCVFLSESLNKKAFLYYCYSVSMEGFFTSILRSRVFFAYYSACNF